MNIAPLFLLLLLFHRSLHVGVCGEVVFVYSLQRHGAREALPKGPKAREETHLGGPPLIPTGERWMDFLVHFSPSAKKYKA